MAQSGITGVGFTYRAPRPTTPNRQAGFTGISFTIITKTLTLKVFAWDGAAYQPVAGVVFDITVSRPGGFDTFVLVTTANGGVTTDFDGTFIEAVPRAPSLPSGYAAPTGHYAVPAKSKNRHTITLLYPPHNPVNTSFEAL